MKQKLFVGASPKSLEEAGHFKRLHSLMQRNKVTKKLPHKLFRTNQPTNKLRPFAFVAVFGLVGGAALLITHAEVVPEKLEGTLLSYHGDNFEKKVSKNIYFLKTADNVEHYLEVQNNERLVVKPGDKVRVHGRQVGNRFKVAPNKNNKANITLIAKAEEPLSSQEASTLSSSEPPIKQAPDSSTGNVLAAATKSQPLTKKTLVIPFNFTNDQSQPYSSDNIRDRIFTAPYSLNANYQKMSFGKAPKLIGKNSPDGDVSAWLTIPSDNHDCETNFRTWTYLAQRELIAKYGKRAFSGYDNVFYEFPSPAGSDACPWGGLSNVYSLINPGYQEIWLPLYDGLPQPGATEHEYGHSISLDHAGSMDCRDSAEVRVITIEDPVHNCTFNEYGDFYDVMGAGDKDKLTQMNSRHKEQLSWIPPSNVQTVTASGTYTVDASDASSSAVQILRVPLPKGGYYYIEYVADYREGTGYRPQVLMRLADPDHDVLDINHATGNSGVPLQDTALMWLRNTDGQPPYKNDYEFELFDTERVITDPTTKISFKVVDFNQSTASIEILIPEPPPPPPSASLPRGLYDHSTVESNGYVYVIGGSLGDERYPASNLVYYAKVNPDGSIGSWATSSIPLPRYMKGQSSVAANGYVYIIAGAHNTIGPNGQVYGNHYPDVYYAKVNPDGSLEPWVKSPYDLPKAMSHHAAVVANSYVYVLGGYGGPDSDPNQNTVYSAKLNTDGSIGPWVAAKGNKLLPQRLSSLTAVVANGYAYTIGGYNFDDGYIKNVYYAKLNPDGTTGAWTLSGNFLPRTIRSHASFAANGYIYALGGQDDFQAETPPSAAIYYAKVNPVDGSTGPWMTNPASLPVGLHEHTTITANGYAYLLGGATDTTFLYKPDYGVQSRVYPALLRNDGTIAPWVSGS